MSTTTRLPLSQALAKITAYNRYSILANMDNVDDDDPAAPTPSKVEPIPSFCITAPELNQMSLLRHLSAKLKRRKKRNGDVAAAENDLRSNSMDMAVSAQDVLARHANHEKQRHALREFYFSNRASKDSRTLEIMKRIVLDRIAARERLFISGGKASTVIHCIGTAGTCVGSRMKGHAKRGGASIRKRHRRYGPIAMTNEGWTSQTCSCCFAPTVHPRKRKLIKGTWRTVVSNGTTTCINPRCPRYQLGIGAQNRDKQAAECIAISASSLLLTGQRLACFEYTSDQRTGHHPIPPPPSLIPLDAGQVTVPTVIP